MKPFYFRPDELRHAFEDEFAHTVWGPDLGLAATSVAAVPLYTLTERRVVYEQDRQRWAWEYKGRYHDGVLSTWLTEDETKDSFSPLQLDVFHALWEMWPEYAAKSPRPPGSPTRGAKEVESREAALREFPQGTEVGREFTDAQGRTKFFRGKVCDFSDPYWRVEYHDGDWEELTRREVTRGMTAASRPTDTSGV